MQEKVRFAKVLLCQSVGFIAIMLLSWFNEMVDLRSLVFGNHPYISDFRESALEMLFVLAVWLIVAASTRRLLTRVNQLEQFLRVCSWCRRIRTDDGWVQMEDFLSLKFETRTSHGACDDCLQKQRAALHVHEKQKLFRLDLPRPKIAEDGA